MDNLKVQSKFALALPIVCIFLAILFPKDELRVFVLFIALILIFIVGKYDGRILVTYGLILLFITFIYNIFITEGVFSQQILIRTVFWLFIGGTLTMFIELSREVDEQKYPKQY